MIPAIRFAVVLVVSAFAIGTWAQQAPNSPSQHQHATPNLIDGAVHPELIPDSVAYRLYLVALSTGQNPTEVEQKRQRVHLMKTGLGDTDQQVSISVLSDFRAKYDALVAEYNDSAKAAAARKETTDVHTLLKKLDDLVQFTRDTISVRLSPQGAAKLHSFVVSEKKNMKVTEDCNEALYSFPVRVVDNVVNERWSARPRLFGNPGTSL